MLKYLSSMQGKEVFHHNMIIFSFILFFLHLFCTLYKSIWIAIINMIILSFIFIPFFHFVFIQAINTSGLDWRISLLPMNTCLRRLVYNHLTLTGQTDSQMKEKRSVVPQWQCVQGNGTTTLVTLKCITSARNQPHTPRYQVWNVI